MDFLQPHHPTCNLNIFIQHIFGAISVAVPALGMEVAIRGGSWDDDAIDATPAECAAEHQGGAAHVRWGWHQDDGLDMGVFLQEGGDGDGFAAGGANFAWQDVDACGGYVELVQHTYRVAQSAGHVNVEGIEQQVAVGGKFDHEQFICQAGIVEVGSFQLAFGGAAHKNDDGVGRLQGSFNDQPVPAAPQKQWQEQGSCDKDGG